VRVCIRTLWVDTARYSHYVATQCLFASWNSCATHLVLLAAAGGHLLLWPLSSPAAERAGNSVAWEKVVKKIY
jgi:hypothetical protein